MASSPTLRHQPTRSVLRYQAWLTTHVKNPKNLTRLIYPSKKSNQLGLSISSGIANPFERSTSLVCPFCLALWKKENFLLLVLDGA